LPFSLCEGHRGQNLKQGASIRTQGRAGEDEPLRLDDLVIARHWIDGAIGAALVNADGGTRP